MESVFDIQVQGAVSFTGTDKVLGRASAGAGAAEEITCTSAGRDLLDDANAAAQRTTLGLGAAATHPATDFSPSEFYQIDAIPIGWAIDGTVPPGALSTLTSTNKAKYRAFAGDANNDVFLEWMVPYGIDPTQPIYFQVEGWITNSVAPHLAVAAQGTITMSGIATADQTFSVGVQTFTWKAQRGTPGTREVTIGADAAAACTNIIYALNTDASTTVVATQGAGTTVLVTAYTAGTGGNSITLDPENSSNMAADGSGTLGGTTLGMARADAIRFDMKGASIGSTDLLSSTLGSIAVSSVACSNAVTQYGRVGTGFYSAITITNLAAGELVIFNLKRNITDQSNNYDHEFGAGWVKIKYAVIPVNS
jgi:hypothetical protein